MPEPEAQALSLARMLAAPPAFPRLERMATRALARLYRLAGLERYDDYRLERVAGLRLLVTPSVFNPRLLRTGAFFATQLDAQLLGAGSEVLDMGTGSGVCALAAARHAARVVAVDINPAAVLCARLNAQHNGLEARVSIRAGDLFEATAGERFDRVLFNPPFVRGVPRSARERAWCATDVAERFAAGLRAHLRPGGCALLLLSSYGDSGHYLRELARQRFALTPVAARRFVGERLVLFRADPT